MSQPEQEAGQNEIYAVGEKKTIEEYTKLDAEDESLAKWKASLGLSGAPGLVAPGDKRSVVILEMALLFPEDPSLKTEVFKLEDVSGTIKKDLVHFSIKENSVYELRIKFRVQHEIITGLKYMHTVKKNFISVEDLLEPLGSYAPNTVENPFYEKSLGAVEAPSGMLARGNYSATTKFVDDDHTIHLQFPWSFKIVK